MLQFLLVLAWIGLVQAAARPFQRRRGQAREGWWHLTPGPYELFGLASGLVLVSVFTLVSTRPETPLSQKAITAFFVLVTLALAIGFVRIEVRWNHGSVERRDLWGRRTRIGFAEIATLRNDWQGRKVIGAFDGRTIPVSPYANGYAALMARIEASQGDLPPPAEVPTPSREAMAGLVPGYRVGTRGVR